MKYTIDQVAYMTHLSVSTARQYAWKLDAGDRTVNRTLQHSSSWKDERQLLLVAIRRSAIAHESAIFTAINI
jgi:hypothetical protein